jgi:hypothetical protein
LPRHPGSAARWLSRPIGWIAPSRSNIPGA